MLPCEVAANTAQTAVPIASDGVHKPGAWKWEGMRAVRAGAQASPLQCVPLADSCLALGAASCRAAVEALHAAASQGELGDLGRDARVVYGQTDSLCAFLPARIVEGGIACMSVRL